MPENPKPSSRRRDELLAACYAYVLHHGLAGLSLRPLATATGTSPRVLLYLFGSKDALVRELLDRARREQMALVSAALDPDAMPDAASFTALVDRLWTWLSAPEQRPVVQLTYEAFLSSLSHTPGPLAGFAEQSAGEWLNLLFRAQPETPPDLAEARATRALALIRGLLLDLLACDEPVRVTAAAAPGW